MDFLSKSQQIYKHTEIKEEENKLNSVPVKTVPLMEQKTSQVNMPGVNAQAYKRPQNTFLEEDFYGRRSMFIDSSNELMESKWLNHDSKSMKHVKAALSNLMQFHSEPVLSAEQLEYLKGYEDKEAGYEYAINAMRESIARYTNLANELTAMCDAYITKHRSTWTDKGELRLGMVKSIREMALADAERLTKEADGIFSDLKADGGELGQVLMNKNWEDVFSEAKRVRRIENVVEASNGEAVEYEGKNYTLQVKPQNVFENVDSGSILKNVAAYQTAKYLGIESAFAETYGVQSKNPEDIAVIQENVKGATLKQIYKYTDKVHFSDNAKRQISNIAIFDCLSGYSTRDASKITAEYSHNQLEDGTEYVEIKSVKITDNTIAFTSLIGADSVKIGVNQLIDIKKIKYIDRNTFDAIMSLDTDTLGFLVAGTGMTDTSKTFLRERLDYVKEALSEKYNNDGDELFRLPTSAYDLIDYKNINEELSVLEGGIDTVLKKAPWELDLKVKIAKTRGNTIKELEGKPLIEEVIAEEQEVVPVENDGAISFALEDVEEEQQEIEENVVQGENINQELNNKNFDDYAFREEEEDVALEQEKEEEISKEEEIHQYEEKEIVNFHIPGGDILHEKYRSKKEHMKFEGMSYYKQRAKLTEREMNVGENLNLMHETEDARLLKESMDKLSSFHTSSVLTEEQRAKIKLEDPDTYPLLRDMIMEAAEKYTEMVEALSTDIRKYIVTHKAKTANGKQWIDSLKKLRRMLNLDKLAFKDEVDNITYNISAEADEIKGILDGNNWLSILSVSRSISGAKMIPIGDEEIKGASGTTSKYEFRGRRYFRKNNDPNNLYGSPMNTVGSYRMSGLLMTDDIYVEAFRVKERNLISADSKGIAQQVEDNNEYAIVMEAARGKMLRELRTDKSTSGVAYSDEAKQQISRLLISDFIMGQMDRKDDNIMMDAEKRKSPDGTEYWYVKSIQAIDSDQSLLYTRIIPNMESGFAFAPNINMLQYVDKTYYTYLMNLDVDTFAKTAAYTIADIAEEQDYQSNKALIEQTVKIMSDRLEYMKSMLQAMHDGKGDDMFNVPKHASDIMIVHRTKHSVENGNRQNLSEFINMNEHGVEVRKPIECRK